MHRLIPVLAVLLIASCAGSPGRATTASNSPGTTSEVTTSPVTTTPVTTSPIGGGTAPDGTTATVDTVFDGDSMLVTIGGVTDEVRMLGINAPENGECFADRARDLLLAMAGGEVTLIGAERDQYDRRLAYVYVGETNLNEEMIRAGGAIAMSDDHPLRSDFIAAEQDATLRGIGLWAPAACGSVTAERTVAIWTVEADAPGRDDENPNGEYVVLGNSGDTVDLTGWVLRDESSVHRYPFPDGFEIGPGAFVDIRSGCGADTPTELYWCAGGSVWNNAGDTAFLLDANGTFVSRFRYIDE
ncbi:MAG TPA: lamin tail domain-containing protein [Acidimicrobiia bacterium]|nr:lamin tail domain-containing protein [Acidimicrobiia bacterium]